MSKFVPKYTITFTREKCKDFAVVIPVINEGNRIINLLKKIQSLKINEISDIIIVDGGSTDGSLQEDRLKDLGVATLLVKQDVGKLSAQLLCAYDFCNNHKYEGIVTIDGNDKDDPKDIPTFIKKIKEGYDFIQASRFISGGYAENTPLSRWLAIKLLHAPMLSIASGFRWTDTTQGFRGYSAKMLFSDKIKIFRPDFKDYELLAYLSYAGPKFGFKCIEIGTRRIYPKGQIPTKISAVKGNISLLKTLWSVCIGKFNP